MPNPKTCAKCGRTRSIKYMKAVPGEWWCSAKNRCREIRKQRRRAA